MRRRGNPSSGQSQYVIIPAETYRRQQSLAYWDWGNQCFWWFFGFIFLGFLITFIVVAFTQPSPAYNYYHEGGARDNSEMTRRKPDQCTLGEVYDHNIELCAPVTNAPFPIDPDIMDNQVSPCDSFYTHMCGKWIKNHTNENRAFTYLYRKNRKHIHDIVTHPDSGPIYRMYRSCLDTLINGHHIKETQMQRKHVREYILGALHSFADLPVVFARLNKYGYTAPFQMSIERHPQTTQLLPMFRFDGWQEEDIDSQLFSNPERLTQLRSIVRSLNDFYEPSFINFLDTLEKPTGIISLSDFMRNHKGKDWWTLYFRELNGWEMSVELERNAEQLAWPIDATYMKQLFEKLEEFSLEQWKSFVEYAIVEGTHNFLPTLPTDSYFREHDLRALQTRHLEHRWKRNDPPEGIKAEHCILITHKLLPGMVARAYLDQYMPEFEQTRAEITRVVQHVRNAFAGLIEETEWLSSETKELAATKIRSMIVRAVHPNIWEVEDFHDRIASDRYLHNLDLVRQYRAKLHYERWFYGGDRDALQRFGAPLSTVNAYYSPLTNTITVFAGLVQPPFYRKDFAPVALYATLGMIAGHEMAHGLDNTGRLFTSNGALPKGGWWKAQDVEEFNRRSQCLVREFNMQPNSKTCSDADSLYGERTLGEAIADLTGFQIAYKAYFDYSSIAQKQEKAWFMQVYSQMWCESFDDQHRCAHMAQDEHGLAIDRVDKTLRNTNEFSQAFPCVQGGMVNTNKCKLYG